MRCPDCNKFVGMENGDVEHNDIDWNYDSMEFTLQASGEHSRNCADCGTQLKSICWDAEDSFQLESMEGWSNLTPEQQSTVRKALKNSKAEVEIEVTDSHAEEAGGSRYQKNMITIEVDYNAVVTVTVNNARIKLEYNGVLTATSSASEYEECC